MTGDTTPTDPKEFVREDLLALQDGQSFSRSSYWEGEFNESFVDALWPSDLFLAVGESVTKGYGDFTFHGEQGDRIRFEGTVTHRWDEPYDWDEDGTTWIPEHGFVHHEDAVRLRDYGGAKPFMMHSEWRQSVRGVLRKQGKRLVLESIEWSDIE